MAWGDRQSRTAWVTLKACSRAALDLGCQVVEETQGLIPAQPEVLMWGLSGVYSRVVLSAPEGTWRERRG